MQTLHLQDLGGAGHDGFEEASPGTHVEERRYVRGGHSAALEEEMWAPIAEFVLTGVVPHEIPDLVKTQSPLVNIPAKGAPLLWVGLIAMVVWIGFGVSNLFGAEWLNTLAVVAYTWLVFRVLTRL